jgi:hypothetical protein
MADAPQTTGAKRALIAAREARLGDALRDNLRRRKEQARARDERAGDQPDHAAAKHEPPA